MDILYIAIAAAFFGALAWIVRRLPDFESRRES